MKKALFIGLSCLVFLLVMSCTTVTATPGFYSHTSGDFEVLGEVIIERATPIGFIDLLRAARELYPEADFVIDIMKDTREIVTSIPGLGAQARVTWIARGTAIRYNR